MFNIFKRKKREDQNWEYDLLKAVVEKLPSKYLFLNNQINKEFILKIVPNELLKNGWRRTIIDFKLYNSFKKEEINYKLTGISIFNFIEKSYKKNRT